MTKKLNLFEIWVLGLANLGVKATTYPWKESWFIMVNLLALTHTWEHTRIAILRIYLYIIYNIIYLRTNSSRKKAYIYQETTPSGGIP